MIGKVDLLGTVAGLRRYPVKSMLGETVPVSDVTGTGLARDRGLAVVHRETGKVASAKNPRLWRGLLTLASAATDSAVQITRPDGKILWSNDADIDDILSELLGQPVTLTATPPPGATLDRARPDEVLSRGVGAEVSLDASQLGAGSPEGTFFDFAPVHLLTTSALSQIADLSPRGTVEPERYRPNIIIRTENKGFVENAWVGEKIQIGNDLTLSVMASTPRCAVPTLVHGDLPRDTNALRVLAEHNRVIPLEGLAPQPCAGVYAQVLEPGRIQLGDHVRLA